MVLESSGAPRVDVAKKPVGTDSQGPVLRTVMAITESLAEWPEVPPGALGLPPVPLVALAAQATHRQLVGSLYREPRKVREGGLKGVSRNPRGCRSKAEIRERGGVGGMR